MSDITVYYNEEKMLLPVNENGNLPLNSLRQHFPKAEGLAYVDKDGQIQALAASLDEIIINPQIKEYKVHINEASAPATNSSENEVESEISGKINTVNNISIRSSMKTRRKSLRVGWLHKADGEKNYCKMKKPLGGVKRLKLDELLSYPAKEIKKMAVEEFTSNANCAMEDQFSVHLGFDDGRVISNFEQPDGQICDVWGYCKAYNTTPYKLNLFILTSPKNEMDTEPNKKSTEHQEQQPILIPSKMGEITAMDDVHVFYHYVRISKYSNELSCTECEKVDLHTYVLEEQYGDGPSIEQFDPLDYGHPISRIEKDNKVLLQILMNEDSTKSFDFPSVKKASEDAHTIVHDVDELKGICNGTLGIGFIPNCTDACRPVFSWYRDGELYKKAEFLYWLNDVNILLDGKPHVWSCSVNCRGSERELKSKNVEISE